MDTNTNTIPMAAKKTRTKAPSAEPSIEQTREQIESLRQRGYEYLGSPADDMDISFAEVQNIQINQQFGGCGGDNPMGGPIADRGAETLFSSIELKQSVGQDANGNEIGTPNKGYIKYGTLDRLPLDIYRAAKALPYTAEGLRFLTDITVGRGPALMYPDIDDDEKLIPYERAGAKLKKRIAQLRALIKEQNAANAAVEETSNTAKPTNWSYTPEKVEYRVKKEPAPKNRWDSDDSYANVGTLQDELQTLVEDLKIWDKTNTEWTEFKKHNNLRRHWQECCEDLHHLDICYPTIGLEQGKPTSWQPKITKVGIIPGVCARMEEMDDRLRINYIYYSELFRHKNTVQPTSAQIVAYPTLSIYSRYDDLQAQVDKNQRTKPADRPLWFCCPTSYSNGFSAYYPVPAWWSIFSSLVYKYATTLIFDKAVARQNSTMWGKLIFINMNYLQEYFAQVGAETLEDKKKVRIELVQKINKFLRDRSNNGKTCTLDSFIGNDGKTLINALEIVDVPVKSSADTKDELEEISSIIFFALGLDPRLVGAVPGKGQTSSSGTQSRELYLIKQIGVSPLQQQYEDFWRFVFDWNGWDPKAVMTIRKQVLSTLDRSKTGVVDMDS